MSVAAVHQRAEPKICLCLQPNCAPPSWAASVKAMLDNPRVGCVRLSHRSATDDQLKTIVEFLKECIGERHTVLVITSRIDLVAPLALDGVHLNGSMGLIRQARSSLGKDAVIGAFCGATRDRGLVAAENGADYVSFGPISQTDQAGVEIAPPSLFSWWKEFTTVASMAEGGIVQSHLTDMSLATDYLVIEDLSHQI